MEQLSSDGLVFTPELLRREPPSGIDVVSGLQHFAIVTYAIPPERLRPHVHPRFELDCIEGSDGERLALVSMVPFMDDDFHFQRVPFPRFRFGQTNYRAYVIDSQTGKRAAWFFGTSLDSWTVAIPHRVWKLPWHRAHIQFDCEFDESAGRYSHYRMSTASAWAPVGLELEDSGEPVRSLPGFGSLEAGEVLLTHPLDGAYYRASWQLPCLARPVATDHWQSAGRAYRAVRPPGTGAVRRTGCATQRAYAAEDGVHDLPAAAAASGVTLGA